MLNDELSLTQKNKNQKDIFIPFIEEGDTLKPDSPNDIINDPKEETKPPDFTYKDISTNDKRRRTSQDIGSKTNCCLRYFSPIKGGSLRGSIFSLASICFDTTSLTFPLALSYTGLIPGSFMLLVMALLSFWSLNVLLYAGRKRNVYSYRELIVDCLGSKMAVVADINNIIFSLGAQTAYIVTISRFFGESFTELLDIDFTKKMKAAQMAVSMVCLQIPLSLLKDISKLQYASMAGSLVLIIASIVMFLESFFYYRAGVAENRSIVLCESPNLNYLDAFSVFLFGHSPHNGLFLVLNELSRPDSRRSKKVIDRAYTFQGFLFFFIAYAGFFSLIDDVPPIFLSRPPLKDFDHDDYLITSVKLLFVLSLHCLCAINFNLLRGTFKFLLFKGKDMTTFQNYYVTTIMFLVCNLIAFFADNVVQIIGVISGISVTFICYVFPVLCYIKANDYGKWHYKNVTSFLVMAVLSVIGLFSTIKSALENF